MKKNKKKMIKRQKQKKKKKRSANFTDKQNKFYQIIQISPFKHNKNLSNTSKLGRFKESRKSSKYILNQFLL